MLVDTVPGRAAIMAAAAWVHRAIDYQGGRVSLEDVFDGLPGLVLAPMTRRDLLGRAGATMRIGDQVKIGFDAGLPRSERRRVVAHELGHALLHVEHLRDAGVSGVRFATEEIGEAQADLFAQEFLAPRWALRGALRDEATLRERSRRELATLFSVPEPLIRVA